MAANDDDLEITITLIKQAFICKVPPLASAEGHRAENWDRTAIWDGRLRIVTKGKQTIILLEHTRGADAGGLYAACPIHNDPKRPPAVDYVLDSSRYFVLRFEDGRGRHAYMGLFFQNRDDAFDFKTSLQHQQNMEREEDKAKEYMSNLPARDLSLDSAGGHITINLKSKVVDASKSKKSHDDDDHEARAPAAKMVALAPPKKAAAKARAARSDVDHVEAHVAKLAIAEPQPEPQTQQANDFDWADFEAAPEPGAANKSDEWSF